MIMILRKLLNMLLTDSEDCDIMNNTFCKQRMKGKEHLWPFKAICHR